MGLLVWLPLTKDLSNQGLSNVTVTNYGATYNTSGKLGGSYYFNGSSYIHISLPSGLTTIKNSSVCVWVKSTGSVVALGGISSDSTYAYPMMTLYTSGWQFAGTSAYKYISGGSIANSGVWHHVCCTAADNVVTTYLDGVVVASKTYSEIGADKWDLNTSVNFLEIGCDHPGGNEFLTGYVNDFRVYNHCLSAKEVKELSKGLVAHYKLDDKGQANLLKNSNFTEGTNGLQGITATAGSTLTKQSDCLKVVSTGASYGFYTSNFDSITTGDMTTFSAWVKSDANMTIYIGTDGSGNSNCQSYTIGTSWQLISISKAKTTNNANLRIYGVGTFYVRYMKYELGDKITKWCPNSADSIYATLRYNDTTVYDCSGYNYHGSTLGTLTAASDTARYSLSTVFNGSTSGVLIENINLSSIINSDVTYSFQIKPNGENGARSVYFGSFSGTSWSIEKTTGNLLRSYWNGNPDETCTGATITDGVQQHVCIAKKGTNEIKVYINGELKWTSTATHSEKTFPTTYRIGRDTRSNDGTPYKGLMSDFRIYATALSADDVKELYHTSATIDKSGNMYGYELREV